MASPKTLSEYMELDYPIELHRDRERGRYFARHPDLPGCSAGGDTAGDAESNLEESREAWIEARLESGYPVPEPPSEEYGGRISLRIPRGLHASLARASIRQQMSLNQLLTVILAEWSGGISVQDRVERELREILHSAREEEVPTVTTLKATTSSYLQLVQTSGKGPSVFARASE